MFEDACPGFFTVNHFCEIFDNSFLGCVVINGETVQPIGANQAFCAMMGVTLEDILTREPGGDDPEAKDTWSYLTKEIFPIAKKYGHSAPVNLRHRIVATGEEMYLKVQCFMVKSTILETSLYVILVCNTPTRSNWENKDDPETVSVDVNLLTETRLQRRLIDMKLTQTEIAICLLLTKLKTTKEIANELGIAVATVNTHRRNARGKLGLKGERENLYRWLMQQS